MSQTEVAELAEEKGISREQAVEQLQKRSEWLQDLDKLQPQAHAWVDRGLIMSCEGAGHPYHQVSKRR
jgi:FtsZ-binding cell division protein ZapB